MTKTEMLSGSNNYVAVDGRLVRRLSEDEVLKIKEELLNSSKNDEPDEEHR